MPTIAEEQERETAHEAGLGELFDFNKASDAATPAPDLTKDETASCLPKPSYVCPSHPNGE